MTARKGSLRPAEGPQRNGPLDCAPDDPLRHDTEGRPRLVSLLDMLQRYSLGFSDTVASIEALRVYAATWQPNKVKDGHDVRFNKLLDSMRSQCESLGLDNTLELVMFVKSEFARSRDYNFSHQLQHLETLRFAFLSELEKELIVKIRDDVKGYFEQPSLFGNDVDSAFSSCASEIKNAGNCFALEQYEACVFHLMRTLERGLSALAVQHNVPTGKDNWHNIIETVESRIRKMDEASHGVDWKAKQKFHSEAAAQFMFIKEAWRNHVMHARDPYDEGKAMSIFTHVREFMQTLATGGLAE